MLVQQTSTTIGHHCTHQHCENVGINCYQLTSSEKVHFIVKIRTSGSEKKLCTSNQTKWHDTACNTFPRNHSVRFKPHISYYVYIYIIYVCVGIRTHEHEMGKRPQWKMVMAMGFALNRMFRTVASKPLADARASAPHNLAFQSEGVCLLCAIFPSIKSIFPPRITICLV